MLTNRFQSHHKLFSSLSLHKISKDNLQDKYSSDFNRSNDVGVGLGNKVEQSKEAP